MSETFRVPLVYTGFLTLLIFDGLRWAGRLTYHVAHVDAAGSAAASL